MFGYKRINWLVDASILIFAAIILIWVNYDSIKFSSFEIGDYAANSILIQDAKNLDLTVGNYSRLGFNHPGPGILYVLASGEYIFYDVLKMVNSPISGQLVSANIFTALWIFAIYKLLVLVFDSRSNGIWSACIFLCATSFLDHRVFGGIWMPHMYYFPFATMLLALATVTRKKIWISAVLGLSSGFLINGHVSFIPMIVVILFLYYLIRLSSKNRTKSIVDNIIVDLVDYKRHILVLLICSTLFAIPIIIETIENFPGPFYQYYKYGSAGNINRLDSSLVFVSHYWGGPFFMLAAGIIVLFQYINFSQINKTFIDSRQCLIIVLFLATIAFLFYAVKGVDHLDQFYIGIFYYAVPALSIAMIISWCWIKFAAVHRFKYILTFGVMAALMVNISKEIDYSESYNHPEILLMYNELKEIKDDGRLVLDLKTDGNWPYVWANTAGLIAHDKRVGANRLCVNNGWHILFTKEYRCSAAEVASGKRVAVFDLADIDINRKKIYFSVGNLGFSGSNYEAVKFNEYISVALSRDFFSKNVLVNGWSDLEKDFVWSIGDVSKMAINLPADFNGLLSLDVAAFLPNKFVTQELSLEIDGVRYPTEKFTFENSRRLLKYKIIKNKGDELVLLIHVKEPLSPKVFGSDDNRILGVSLYGIEFSEK